MARSRDTQYVSLRAKLEGLPHPDGELASWAYALALAGWASSWNLRNSVLMAWLPISPVWVASFSVALCVAHRCGRRLRVDLAVSGALALLVLGFLPGALRSGDDGYGPVKLVALVFMVLPIVCAAVVLLDSRQARVRWLWAQVLVGLAVTVAALASNGADVLSGRLTLATVDTITTARLVGAAVIALLALGLAAPKHGSWAFPLATLSGMILVHVGSRGPLLGVLISVLVVVIVGRCFAGRRVVLVLGTLAITFAAYRYAAADGGSGGRRIVDWVQSGLSDDVRAKLFNEAVHLGENNLMGIGWGDFAGESKTGHEIENAQGVAYAHNAFAEAFAEGGLFAVLAFVLVLVLAVQRLYRLSSDPYDAVVLGTLVYWLLNAQVSSDFVGNRFMWVSIAVGIAAYADGRPLLRRRRVTGVILPPSGVKVESTAGHRVAEQPA